MIKDIPTLIASTVLVLALMANCAEGDSCKLSQNYCSLCPKGQDHVACVPPKSECKTYSDVSFTQLTSALQDYVVYLHNVYRNNIASGSNSRFSPAAKMATVNWNCEISYLALKNVQQCAMVHDRCRRIVGNPWVGQNLAYVANWGSFYNDTTAIQKLIALWYDENTDTTRADIDQLPDNINDIGHFTQLMQDRSVSVGCAVAKYRGGQFYYTSIACNYWFSNVDGQPVFETSSKPGSKCKTGQNSQFKALCSPNEKYDFGGLIAFDG